jgi:nucleoside-diphosphate kinase
MERTLAIIKPDAVASGKAGKIIAHLEADGFRVLGMRLTRLSEEKAQQFYAVHKERPFYASLVKFMTSGPVIPMALERDGAIARLREIIGATDPAEAAPGTVRALYAESKERNAIHASDALETAQNEVPFFFQDSELVNVR